MYSFRSANGDIGTPVATTNILTDKRSSSNLRASLKDTNNNKRDPAYSTQALFLLANVSQLIFSSLLQIPPSFLFSSSHYFPEREL